MKSIEERVNDLELRNKRVDLDKKWEVSFERKLTILFLTYVVMGLFLTFIGNQNPWVNAIVPSIGFLLSTLTLGYFKRMWLAQRK
jgi:hypothetical protein